MAHPKKAVIFKIDDSDRAWLEAEAAQVAQEKGRKCTISVVLRAAVAAYRVSRARQRKAGRV